MTLRSRTAATVALTLTLAACGGTPSVTPPIQTAHSSTVEPAGTTPGVAATPAGETSDPGQPTTGSVLGNGRPVTISVIIGGTTTQSDGTYSATGVSRACGNAMVNLTGNLRAFNLEFPFEATPSVENVSFAAEDLVAGSTTGAFHIDLNVITPSGHSPPSLVIDTTDVADGNTGTATLSEAGGTTTLVVSAVDDLGASVQITAKCGPQPA